MPIPTAPKDVTRQVQYYEETTFNTAPVNPIFKNAGVIMDVNVNENIDDEEIRIQGSRLPYAYIKMGREATMALEYGLIDTVLLKYGTDDPLGTGTIAKGLGIMESRKLNGTEMFRIAEGALTESLTISLERIPKISQNFYVPNLTTWMTASALNTYLGITGTGTPQFATAITSAPWTHLTGSGGTATTISVNGAATDVAKMSITVNNNIMKQKPLGNETTVYASAGNKGITLSIEPFLYDTTFRDLVANYTPIQVIATLKQGTPNVTITLDGVQFNTHGTNTNAGNNDFTTEPVQGKAKQITVTQYP